ncbi:Von Willebrand factor A domain-containing protein 8 [Aphelenchoides besseyi]|nr:Von Willebrand factor A domain-containing protein 8 [Aphelenchoides besseyi]
MARFEIHHFCCWVLVRSRVMKTSGFFALVIRRSIHGSNCYQTKVLKIGNTKTTIRDAKNPECVPKGYVDTEVLNKDIRPLKWLLQKDNLKQDVFLIGVPGSIRSSLVLQYLELSNREFEYLSLTRDTTESDIKQRREIRSGNAFYSDLHAVKAALNGRVLVIDGVEKAERNVLPILNNLLENREMQLDDGRFLMKYDKFDKLLEKYDRNQLKKMNLERVSEDFIVFALGLPVPAFKGHSLDPPLRSRFQCLNMSTLPFKVTKELCEALAPNVEKSKLNKLLSLAYGLNVQQGKDASGLPRLPIDNLMRAVAIWNKNPNLSELKIFEMCYPTNSILRDADFQILEQFLEEFNVSSKRSKPSTSKIVNIQQKDNEATVVLDFDGKKLEFDAKCGLGSSDFHRHAFVSTPQHETFLAEIALTHSTSDFCILGPAGSGKTIVLEEFARRFGYKHVETIALYQDLNSRELLQSRQMLSNGDTVWRDGELVQAAKNGDLCVLDGLDKVHWSTAEVLAPLIHHRFLHLPDGTRLVSSKAFGMMKKEMNCTTEDLNKKGVFEISPRFRLVALADSESVNASGPKAKWLNEQILSLFLFHTLPQITTKEELELIKKLIPNVHRETATKLIQFVHKLRESHDSNIRSVGLSLSLRRLIFILRRHAANPTEGVYEAIHRAALARFLPTVTKTAFENTLQKQGIEPTTSNKTSDEQLKEQLLSISRTGNVNAADATMIPDIVFFQNEQHVQVMSNMAKDFELSSHLLLIGNQGVGKNKVTDRFLQLIKRPRKYMQLHRDTTVQSLTVQTTVVDGVLKHEDSPLVTAVRDGLVLVIDEGDKAPLQVVAVLKSLLDSGFLHLSDGRRIQPPEIEPLPDGKSIAIHPDFRLIMLANRPGFPFLGNDLFGVIGDLFSIHVVDNPDRASEVAMLKNYGPNVKTEVIEQLVGVFDELRTLSDSGQLMYPYSTRELVNIVKHLDRFPDDSIPVVARNVFDFDAFSKDTVETVEQTFRKHGIALGLSEEGFPVVLAQKFPLKEPKSFGEWGVQDNVVPYRASTAESPIQCRDRTILSFRTNGIEVKQIRAYGFTEQETYWQLNLNEADICSDVLSIGSRVVVASVNPPSIHIIPTPVSKEAFKVDLSFFLPKRSQSYQPRITLAKFGPSHVLIHEEVKNTLLKLGLEDNSIERLVIEEEGFLGKLLPQSKATNSQHWRIVSVDENTVVAFQRASNDFIVFDAKVNRMRKIGLPDDLRVDHVLPIDTKNNDRFLVISDKLHYLLTIEQPDRTFLRQVRMTDSAPIHMEHGRSLERRMPVTSTDSATFDAPEFMISSPDYYAIKSTNFPLTFEAGSLIGWPRDYSEPMIQPQHSFYSTQQNSELVHPSKSSVLFSDGLIVRSLPLWNTPEKARKQDTNSAYYSGFLEVVNTRNATVQFVPVPMPRNQNYYMSWFSTIAEVRFVVARGSDGQSLFTCDSSGGIRKWQLDEAVLSNAYGNWRRQLGLDSGGELNWMNRSSAKSTNRINHTAGGTQWLGGTGGYNTAGLGGVGGPFRLDAGHGNENFVVLTTYVKQISEAAKQQVPEEIKRKARAIAKREFEKRLKEIEMSEHDADSYQSLYSKIAKSVNHMKSVLESLEAKEKKNDCGRNIRLLAISIKLIEGMTGEKTIYRKRVELPPEPGTVQTKPKRLRLLVDVSGSMYRFNGHDKRLQKSLETTLLVMESLIGKEDKIKYDVYGHSGENPSIDFTSVNKPPTNEKQRLDVLKRMLAHSQFCISGDYTLEAIELAARKLSEATDVDERFVIALSDANLSRYGIRPTHINRALNQEENVNVFLILIGSLGSQADELRKSLPAGKAFIAKSADELPQIMQQIFASTLIR